MGCDSPTTPGSWIWSLACGAGSVMSGARWWYRSSGLRWGELMRSVSDWTEADLQQLIDNDVQESLHLDYKRSAALGRTDPCRNELSKDVAAFANSDGGMIVY